MLPSETAHRISLSPFPSFLPRSSPLITYNMELKDHIFKFCKTRSVFQIHYVSSGQESTNSSCLALKLLVCLSLTGQKNVTFQLRKKRNFSHNPWRMSAEVHPMAGKRVSSQLLACLPQREKKPTWVGDTWSSQKIMMFEPFDWSYISPWSLIRFLGDLKTWQREIQPRWMRRGRYRENIRWSNARFVWTTDCLWIIRHVVPALMTSIRNNNRAERSVGTKRTKPWWKIKASFSFS